MNRRSLLSYLVFALGANLILGFAAQAQMKVVTTLSTYADIVKSIGGELVESSSIASPRFNPHFIEPKPSDVFKLKRADLFVHSGLDLEAWRDPLVQASGRADLKPGGERQLDLSAGIRLLQVPQGQPSRAEGDIHLFGNPHYWMSPYNGLQIARSIAAKLAALDAGNSAVYAENLRRFEEKLKAKILLWQAELKPYAGTELIGYHNEWIYLVDFMGMRMDQYLEPKPGIPPSPKHIEELVQYVQSRHLPLIIQPSFFPKDAGETLERLSGAKLIVLCQAVGELPQASDYISMLDFNIATIVGALKHA